MQFAYPYVLFLLLVLPVLAGLLWYAMVRRKKAMEQFGESHLTSSLSDARGYARTLKAGLTLAALGFGILALARPQFGTKLVEIRQRGADVVIAVDVSSSMLAEDIKPSRLTRAKETLSVLIQQLSGNRVGIVAFAGAAFWQCPLTLDISSANLFLQVMDANLIPLPGTAIGDAVRLSMKGLEKTAPKSKAIVLLTDGEDHKSDPEGAAREAASQGIRIYTVGFGNPQGEPIPQKDAQGNFAGYKKDAKGNVVMSKMDEGLLAKMASITGGEYFRAPDGHLDTSRLLNDIQNLDRQKLSSRLNREYEDRYQIPLFFAVLLLVIAFLLPETKHRI